jgi:TatA/E family protein of Tat protein translocase
MPNIGPGELILILVIALIFIGPGKLPEVGSSIGKSLREFRKASSDVQEAAKVDVSIDPIPAPAPVVAAAAPVVAAAAVVPAATAVPAVPAVPDADAIAAAKATLAAAEAHAASTAAAGATPGGEPPLFPETSEPGVSGN